MKIILLFFLALSGVAAFAQKDTTLLQNDAGKITLDNKVSDTTDPRPKNGFGDLLRDDPRFNPKYPVWIPITRVLTSDVFNWAVSRYVFNYDWARISSETWKTNLQKGPEWDNDGFGFNFIGHPHTGNGYFNVARSNGYNYWQSVPFAIEGSVIWEFLGENTRPSYNDLVNTPISGAFLGEVFYRISSNILDDRTRGVERVWRELLAGAINPTRALNRLTQGKMFRVTNTEVYQKERVNLTFNAGVHLINEGTSFGTGTTNGMLNMQIDYGSPFDKHKRKPFDVFRLKIEMGYGSGQKLLENVHGYGLLAGRHTKHASLLGGVFQHFDYWNNSLFEVAAIGFGAGVITRKVFSEKNNLFTNIHIAGIPLAGNNTRFGPDTSSIRTYNYGGGAEVKVEETINLFNRLAIGFNGFLYWIRTYVGLPGTSLVTILRPNISVRLFKNVSLGFEQHIYFNDRYVHGDATANLHLRRTEQKIFLQLFLEDPKRSGKYK